MLIALIHKSRAKAEGLTEDEITSTIFNPLKFMASHDAWQAFCEAGLISQPPLPPNSIPKRHFVDFWPTFKNPDPGEPGFDDWYRESPDVLFRFEFEGAQELWLILEVKWNAPASGQDDEGRNTQLAHQWIAVTGSDQANSVRAKGNLIIKHTYLTKNFSDAWKGKADTQMCAARNFDRSQRNQWAANFLPLTWADLRANLENVARLDLRQSNSSQLCCWAAAASEFLKIKNVMPFHGFGQVDPPDERTNYSFGLRSVPFVWPSVCLREPFRFGI